MRAELPATLDRVRPVSSFLDWLSRGVPGEGRRLAALAALALVAVQLGLLVAAWQFDPFLALAGGLGLWFVALCVLAPNAAWLLTLASVPFSMETLFPALASALWLPTEPMMLVFLGVWAVRSLVRGAYTVPRSPVLLGVVVFALVAALSSAQSEYPFLSVKALVSATWLMMFGFFYPLTHDREGRLLRAGFRALAFIALGFSIYGVFFVMANGVARWTGNAMGRPFFPEHGTYSTYVSFGMAALLGLTLSARSATARFGGAAAALTMVVAIVLSLARAAYLGLIGLAVVFVAPQLRGNVLRVAIVGALAFGAVAGAVATFRAGEFIGLYVNSIAEPGEASNLERISRWLAAARMAEDRPLLGVGFGNFEDSYYRYRILTLRTQERFRRMGAHSEYFKILGETGWLGVAALTLLLALFAREARVAIRGAPSESDRALAIAAAAGVASYLVHAVFNNYGGIDKVAVPFWFLVATIAVLGARVRAATR